ncbi:hypothetical protein BDP27DRAFT_1427170 [Rhodocollybia butyracea]|uniref:Uncharacterized protein n=1 Tax=Rhodocollybia butyracea TaxID=206335 RepID=A0A9P5PFX7_9AGAR|nr:hypothetical protein BDP27DRAFT_1427170 [Rhodocollybia butyracea]
MPTSNSYSLSPTILMPTILSLTTHYLEYAQSMLSRCLAPALAMQLLTIQVVDGTLFGLDLDRPVLKRSRKAVSYSSDHLGNSKVIHSTNTQQTPVQSSPEANKNRAPIPALSVSSLWTAKTYARFPAPLAIRSSIPLSPISRNVVGSTPRPNAHPHPPIHLRLHGHPLPNPNRNRNRIPIPKRNPQKGHRHSAHAHCFHVHNPTTYAPYPLELTHLPRKPSVQRSTAMTKRRVS